MKLVWLSRSVTEVGSSLRQHRILDLDTRVRHVQGSIVTVHPTGPGHEVLVRLLKEVKEELRGHIFVQNALHKEMDNIKA